MIVFLTTLLILLCLAVVLLILIQRTSGGMGSALGGGAADQYLGAGSAAQLSKLTVWGILFFFVLSFGLYALYQSEAGAETELLRSQDIAPVILPGDTALPAPADSIATPSEDASPATPVPAQPLTSGNSSQ
jgi:preprotein translocase subunit SecG